MPLPRPTLTALKERCATSLASQITNAQGAPLGTLAPRGVLRAIANTQAGLSNEQLGRIELAAREFFPDTCSTEQLDVWGRRLSLPRKVAVAASGAVSFTGTNGSTIPQGAIVQRADGAKFATVLASTVLGGMAQAEVLAVLPGALGNTSTGTAVTLISTAPGVDAAATVATPGIDLGADEEEDEDYRARILQRIAAAPGAGTEDDYLRWTLEVPGVTRAWVLVGNQGPGTVGVTFVLDDDPVSIIPSAAKVAEVQDWLDDRRPATASVLVFAPVLVPVDFTIDVTPDETAVRDSVAESLAELFRREGGPNRTIPLSHVREAISLAPGETDHVLTVPSADLVLTGGQVPTVGTITWV